MFTFLPLEEINQVGHLKGADLNKAKAVLAFEATRICHGEDEAIKALEASVSMFGGLDIPGDLLISSSIPRKTHLVINKKSVPSSSYNKDDVVEKVSIIDLFMDSGLCKSKSDARRLIQQGGAYINGDRVASFDQIIISEDIKEDEILLRAGKKKYHKIILI